MLWPLARSSTPLWWEASLLVSLLVHGLVGMVVLMPWPEAERLSQNVIPVELVTLPATVGTELQRRDDGPVPRAPQPVRQVKPEPPQPVSHVKPEPPQPAKRVKPVPPPAIASPPQQPRPKSTRQTEVLTQAAASSMTPGELEADLRALNHVSAEHVQEQPAAAQIGRQVDPAAAGRASSPSPPASSDLEPVRAAFLQSVGILIDKQKSYPLMARKGRQQGVVHMVFTLNREGHLENCQVKESSGFRLLDKAALKAIRGVQRYPSPPAALGENPSFQIAISFRLDD